MSNKANPTRILGIDPGTGICGFGVLEVAHGEKPKLIDVGAITTPPHTPLVERLMDIYDSMEEIIKQNHPDCIAIEKLFFMQNISTGISVAEARGVVLLAGAQQQLPIYEYSPNEIKKTMTGYGHAHKKQMQEMVRLQLGMKEIIRPDDAADAVAIALVHWLLNQNTI